VTLVFVVPRQKRCRQVMQPVFDSIHEFFVGVEALGSQPDLHLSKERVIAWQSRLLTEVRERGN
jgi:hypothetical protein